MIIPAKRCYYLLVLGTAIAFVIANFVDVKFSILTVLLFDFIIFSLTFLDGQQVKATQVSISRHPLAKLSLARDNPVILSVKVANQRSEIIIKDGYPLSFTASPSIMQVRLEANSNQDLNYTIFPKTRGEVVWGNIQVRQLGKWRLAWYDWKERL